MSGYEKAICPMGRVVLLVSVAVLLRANTIRAAVDGDRIGELVERWEAVVAGDLEWFVVEKNRSKNVLLRCWRVLLGAWW